MAENDVKLKKAFEQFDKDGNGVIDREEFDGLLSTLGAALTREEADAAFKNLDQDDNNTVSFAEFAVWWKVQ